MNQIKTFISVWPNEMFVWSMMTSISKSTNDMKVFGGIEWNEGIIIIKNKRRQSTATIKGYTLLRYLLVNGSASLEWNSSKLIKYKKIIIISFYMIVALTDKATGQCRTHNFQQTFRLLSLFTWHTGDNKCLCFIV